MPDLAISPAPREGGGRAEFLPRRRFECSRAAPRGLESTCHANDRGVYSSEAYRLMKPGGRLAIVDIFLAERDLSVAEVAIYNDFNEGWVVPSLLRRSEYESALASAGFVNIKFLDMQKYVWPSVRILYRYGLVTAPVNLIRHKLVSRDGT